MDRGETEKKLAEIESRLEENAALIERQRLLVARLQMLGEGPAPAETIIELAKIHRALQAQHEALLKLFKP
jgi:hypothetical protein